MKKLAAIIAAVGLSLCSLTGCAQSGVKNSAQATAENPMILTLAHGLSETHTVHIAMTEFADKVKERTNGRIQIQIFPNGQLGSENENMEQLMAGVISMTKVSAPVESGWRCMAEPVKNYMIRCSKRESRLRIIHFADHPPQ